MPVSSQCLDIKTQNGNIEYRNDLQKQNKSVLNYSSRGSPVCLTCVPQGAIAAVIAAVEACQRQLFCSCLHFAEQSLKEIGIMSLHYRGVEYDHTSPQVETTESNMVGHYRGATWKIRQPKRSIHQDHATQLKYRGAWVR
jgi:hypothetical protein